MDLRQHCLSRVLPYAISSLELLRLFTLSSADSIDITRMSRSSMHLLASSMMSRVAIQRSRTARPARFTSLAAVQRPSHCRHASDFSKIQTELPTRHIPTVYDYLVPTPSHLLNVALADVLPHASSPASIDARIVPTVAEPSPLPPTQHLIYFPPPIPGTELLPDGTDPLQSPGDPFVRRMWAGGAVHFNTAAPLTLSGGRAACIERIRDVSVKGREGDEKIFVGIERRVGLCASEDESDASIRARLCRDEEADFGEAGVVERRNIVFMRERSKEQAVRDMEKAKAKQLKPPDEGADYACEVYPSDKLLFRYSALTYNAHAIHLDPQYCREVEGHRGLLVHGPLSFTLLMTLLRRQLAVEGLGEVVKSVEYRNLAPLYAGEKLRLCGRRKDDNRWEIWAETPEGGVAVKGTVKTEKVTGAALDADLAMLGFK